MKYLDVGGGLGGRLRRLADQLPRQSMNYRIAGVRQRRGRGDQEACDEAGIAASRHHHRDRPRDGRHHSVLVFDILDVHELLAGEAPAAGAERPSIR